MKIIKDWKDLCGLENENYKLDIDLHFGGGWLRPKNKDESPIYLTTHSFYEEKAKYISKLLQSHGFDVELESWIKL